MARYPLRPILARLLLLGLLIFALNLAVRPQQVRQSWAGLSSGQADRESALLDPGPSATHYRRLAEAMPWRKDLWHAAALYALRAGEWQAGLADLEQIDFQGLSAGEWLLVGDAYQNLAQPDRAVAAWRQSLSLEETARGYRRLYALHRQQADYPALVDDLQALTRLDPGDADLAYQLAVHLAAQEPAEALEWIIRAPELEGDLQYKMETLEQKLRLATLDDSPARMFLTAGQGLADLGEWALAKAAFQQSVELAPESAEAWAFLGEARQKIEPPEPEAALKNLTHALALDPRSIPAISMLALYWQRQGEFQRASNLFRVAADLEPQNPAWQAALGGLAGYQGKLEDAEDYYLAAVELAPQQSTYYLILSSFYITNQVQVREKALPAALKAVELDPEKIANLTALAQVYLLLDDPPSAIALLGSALDIDPLDAKTHLLLGMAYLYQGQSGLARQHLLLAADNAQDSATLDQAQRAISYYFP